MSASQEPPKIIWLFQIVAALILLQTLFFKFTAAPESVEIFEQLGVEPWGRLASGVVELIAAILILVPSTAAWGAILAAGVMIGAIGSHFFILGIAVNNDGGLLFILALVVFVSSLAVIWLRRTQIPFLAG